METGYEEQSLIVLERRADGWLRIRSPARHADVGGAWISGCALRASPLPLEVSLWSEWFLSDRVSPLCVRWGEAEPLYAGPSVDAPVLATITGNHQLVPVEIQGRWMRVIVVQPPDYCDPDVVSTRREGWVRWYARGPGPRVWYYTRGC